MQKTSSTKRIEFVDIAKGIGIILVVWYHIGYSFGHIFNLFFMPLFFMLSGLFFSVKDDASTFFKKKFRQLIGPLLVGVTPGLALEVFVYDFATFHRTVESGFYNFWLVGNVPFWFLLALFWSMTATYLVERHVKSGVAKGVIYISLSLFGFILSLFQIRNSFFLGQAFLVYPFFLIGYKFRKFWLDKRWDHWAIIIACVVLTVVLDYSGQAYTNIHQQIFSRYYLPSLVAGLSLVIITLYISDKLTNTKVGNWLSFIGESTIFILILHDLFVPLLSKIPHLMSGARWSMITLTICVVSILLCFVCIGLGKTIRHLIPQLFPERRFKPSKQMETIRTGC